MHGCVTKTSNDLTKLRSIYLYLSTKLSPTFPSWLKLSGTHWTNKADIIKLNKVNELALPRAESDWLAKPLTPPHSIVSSILPPSSTTQIASQQPHKPSCKPSFSSFLAYRLTSISIFPMFFAKPTQTAAPCCWPANSHLLLLLHSWKR